MNPTAMKRRQWLDRFVKAAAACIAAVLGYPSLAMLIAPAFRRSPMQWLKVAPLSDFRPDEPKAVTLTYQRRDGWVIRTVRRTVYVVVKADGRVKVLSNICTHANCAVRWEPTKRAFFCPCHDGYFDMDGKVQAGPPPRPLDELPHKVDGGVLFVQLPTA